MERKRLSSGQQNSHYSVVFFSQVQSKMESLLLKAYALNFQDTQSPHPYFTLSRPPGDFYNPENLKIHEPAFCFK